MHEANRSRILWGTWMVVVPLRFLRLLRKSAGSVGGLQLWRPVLVSSQPGAGVLRAVPVYVEVGVEVVEQGVDGCGGSASGPVKLEDIVIPCPPFLVISGAGRLLIGGSHGCVVRLRGGLLQWCVWRSVELNRVCAGDDVARLNGPAWFSGSTSAALFTIGRSK
eukprot:11728340-Heterocapsa_arctica.AAC.1